MSSHVDGLEVLRIGRHPAHARHALRELLLDGVEGPGRGLQVAVHRVVGEVVLGAADVDGHEAAHGARHHPVLVEDDAGGDHEAGVGEEPGVVYGEYPTGLLVADADVVLVLLVALRTLQAVIWTVTVTTLATLGVQ